MRLPKVKNFDSLTADQQYEYKMQALADGKISDIYAIDQVSSLYRQQQLSKLGLNPNLSYEQANTMLSFNKLNQLARDNQLGMEVKPLMDLYGQNPELASKLAEQLFSSGYLTFDEIDKRAKTPLNEANEGTDTKTGAEAFIINLGTSKRGILGDTKSLDDYNPHAFNDYYTEIKEGYKRTSSGRLALENNPDKVEKDILQESRRRYLTDINKNIFSDIQKEIDKYWDREANQRGAEIKKQLDDSDLGPLDSNNISKEFNTIVSARVDADGTEHKGSGWYDGFKDSAFDDFNLEKQKEVIAKYQAYTEILGPQKADEWLNNTMQTWVSDHQSAWQRTLNTVNAFKNTVVNQVITRPLSFGVAGLAKIYDWEITGIANLLGANVGGTVFGDIASILSTGRDQRGRTAEEAGLGALGENGSLFWLRGDYLNKVDQYNTWLRDEQQRAEVNGGISDNMQYVLKPGQNSPDFWSMGNVQDILGMTSQIVGQGISLWLAGGGKGFTTLAQLVGKDGAKALLSKEAANTCIAGFKEATITGAPIAQSYAYNTYKQVYDGAMNMAMENLENEARKDFMSQVSSDKYIEERQRAYQESLSPKGNIESGLSFNIDTEENRKQFYQEYDQRKLNETIQKYKDSRQSDINAIVQGAAADAWMTSFVGEYAKYGLLNAALQPLKVLKSPNQVIQSELRTNAYGKLTQSATGKFIREAVPLFGVKKWATLNPKILGTYNVARNAVVAGGLSNYTDEMVTGFATGFGLSKFNSEYMRAYDPDAYAETWHGGNALGEFMDAIGSGISGGIQAGLTEQAWHAFEIGAIGGILAPRLQGRKEMRDKYSAQNAEELARTGNKKINPWKRFRQTFNTWVTGAVGEYEATRFGLKESRAQVKAYNEAIDQRDELFTELATLQSTILDGKAAQVNNDFSAAANAQDAIAMKIAANQHALSTNPLHQVSNQQRQSDVAQLAYIAQGAVSNEEKERLISEAINASQQGKQGPVTQEMKDQTWKEIQETAKRTSQFVRDYHEEEQRLLQLDASFAKVENYPILAQRAELIAQQKRLTRDIEEFSNRSGLQVKADSRGKYGEMNLSQKESLQEAIQETQSKLLEQKAELADKLHDLEEQLKSATDEKTKEDLSNKILKQRASIRATDRHISELNNSEEAINNSELLAASSGISQDATILQDMLANPEQYSEAQQAEIEKLRSQIGPQGETYVTEMAKMQDQLRDNEYAIQSIQKAPQDFLGFRTMLGASRQDARNRAIYNQELANAYSTIAGQNDDIIGISAALSFTPEQFSGFQSAYPGLSPLVSAYSKVNQAFNSIKSLLDDSITGKDILENIRNLIGNDHEYIRDNGDQGVVDMLEFLKSISTQNPAKVKALNDLITDFKRISSIEQSTTAYSEYKVKQLYERSKEEADQLVETLKKAQQQEQKEALEQEETEEIPDMASMENETEEAIDLEGTEGGKAQAEPEKKPVQEAPEAAETPAETSAEGLPEGVTRNSEGNIETMSTEQQAEQLGLTETKADSMIDDSAPVAQETTEQQEEVHGCFFNPYESQALKAGELVPFTDSHVYNWLSKEGVNLGAIIDDELSHILKVNPKVQLMKVKRAGDDYNVSSNIFLVVEYTDKVSKHHLPENGGVITSNGKQYLIVGTMWNTKSQDGTEVANLMQTTRNNLQKKGVEFFDSNPNERFYVDPVMNTEVTTFYSGHIIHTIDGDTSTHTISELLDEYNRTHAKADQMEMSDLGFGVITMKEGFYTVGPIDVAKAKKHKPQRYSNPNKYGQVYVLVPAANGEIVPIFINPIVLSEMKDGQLKTQIDTQIIPQLLSENYHDREQAISNLCQILCITGSITNPDGKGILIGKENIPTVSLVNGKSVISTYQLRDGRIYKDGQEVTREHFKQDLYKLNPRVNLSLSGLDTQTNLQAFLRYEEAGALTTDAAKLGTFGGKYYVAPINPATGQPMRTEQKAQPIEVSSDYSKASAAPVMLPVGGQTYVFRNGKWVNQKDGKAVTDNAELAQIAWAQKVQNGEASLALRQGSYDYYIAGIETSNPVVVAYNTKTRSYERVVQAFADQIVAERRAELERNRADAEAKKQLESRQPVEEAPDIKQVIDQEAQEDVAESQQPNTQDKTQDVEVSTTENIKPTNVESFLSSIQGPQMYFGAIAKNNQLGYTKVVPEDSARMLGKVEDNKVILVPISNVPNVIGSDYYKNSFEVLHEEQSGNQLYVIKPAVATQQGEKFVVEKKGVIVIANSEQEATKIYNKYHHTKQESTIQKEAATEQRQAQQELARVEEALNSPEVKLWSDNPNDNVIMTTTYGGFSSPMKDSRLWRTAIDYREALKLKEGGTFRDKFRVVYKGKNDITYVEKLNAKDGEVKSAIVVPTSGRSGDNYTLHFYTTLDTASRRLIIDKLIDMKGAHSEELMNAALMLMQSGNNLSYLQYRDQRLLNELKSKASGNNTQASPAKQKNDFELKQSKKQDKQSIESMLDNFSDEAVMEQVDKIYSIVEAKIADAKAGKLDQAHTEKWINFDISNLQSELERIGIQTDNIEDVESWIDNLENCE